MRISRELTDELFFLIGRLHRDSSAAESSVIRKASELYALVMNLEPARNVSLRRKKLGLSADRLGELCRVSVATIWTWEAGDAPAWVDPILDALEERKRDEERRDYLGINDEPEV